MPSHELRRSFLEEVIPLLEGVMCEFYARPLGGHSVGDEQTVTLDIVSRLATCRFCFVIFHKILLHNGSKQNQSQG